MRLGRERNEAAREIVAFRRAEEQAARTCGQALGGAARREQCDASLRAAAFADGVQRELVARETARAAREAEAFAQRVEQQRLDGRALGERAFDDGRDDERGRVIRCGFEPAGEFHGVGLIRLGDFGPARDFYDDAEQFGDGQLRERAAWEAFDFVERIAHGLQRAQQCAASI